VSRNRRARNQFPAACVSDADRIDHVYQCGEKDLPNWLSAKEEPIWQVRSVLARRLPPDQLPGWLTPDEEPYWAVRCVLAARLPVDRLPEWPTIEEEPDYSVRIGLARRVPIHTLVAVDTGNEHVIVRIEVERRIREAGGLTLAMGATDGVG